MRSSFVTFVDMAPRQSGLRVSLLLAAYTKLAKVDPFRCAVAPSVRLASIYRKRMGSKSGKWSPWYFAAR